MQDAVALRASNGGGVARLSESLTYEKPGIRMLIATRVTTNDLPGMSVRWTSQASGTAKRMLTATVPIPIRKLLISASKITPSSNTSV